MEGAADIAGRRRGRTRISTSRRVRRITAASFLFAALSAQMAAAQSLTEALSYAYNTNPQLLAQRALLRATDEQVPEALANWRPTVTVTGQAGYNRAGVETPNV